MKVACIGSNLESDRVLRALVDRGLSVSVLITLPQGSHPGVSDYVDLHPFCQENGIEVIDTVAVNSDETLEAIASHNLDVLFTLGWSQIFSDRLLDCFNTLVVGSHPSDLPKGRGRAPIAWTVLKELRSITVSFFAVDTGVDSGDVILKKQSSLPERPYALEVYDTASGLLAEGFVEIYEALLAEQPLARTPQDTENATYTARRSPVDGLIDFNTDAAAVDRLVRAASAPYPGAYAYYEGNRISIWRSMPYEGPGIEGPVGQILKKQEDMLLVQAADVPLWLSVFTDDAAEPVPLSGFRVGSKFGYNLQEELHRLKELLKKHDIS